MVKKRDWTGQTQGDLTIITESGRDKHGNVLWLCQCTCGAKVHKSNNALINGAKSCSTACGVAASNKRRARHGMWRSKEYSSWRAMRMRCSNPNIKHYASYGGRGVRVHAEWDTSDGFDAFYAYMGPAPDGRRVSIDRIDNDGNYEPGNVRWATPKEQGNNRRPNVRTMFRGKLRTLGEIADLTGELYHRVFQRFRRGLLGEQLVTPQRIGRPPKNPTRRGNIKENQNG
jgi:hypothetical protein